MGKIKQLSLQEIHKIAAGEVIERPASVVKELVENALDAQATSITVYVQQGETPSIRVIDNGYGMDKDDAQKCFDLHATSKLTSFNDILSLTTFGFRGEALTSMSAVSKVTLITKQADALSGIKLIRQNGINTLEEISCQTGTDITIEDLFYNVPARKKFLKTEQTEWRHITQLFQALCFDYPSIHFKLFHNNTLYYHCPAVSTSIERAHQLSEPMIAQSMIPLEHKQQSYSSIQGIISNYQTYRYDRSSLFFFINKRWIKNSHLSKSLLKGYLNILPPDRFPVAVIDITIDPSEIDVNIHPRKEEVAFTHQKKIENQLQEIVRKTLESYQFKPAAVANKSEEIQLSPQQNISLEQLASIPSLMPTQTVPTKTIPEFITQKSVSPAEYTISIQENVFTDLENKHLRIIGSLADTYLIIEHPDGLMLIDQHAAHERILYEQFKSRFGHLPMVPLLFPDIIELSSQDLLLLIKHQELISKHGLIIDQLSKNHVVVKEVATHLKNCSRQELIKDIIALIHEHEQLNVEEFFKTVHEKMLSGMACKAAVKAGDQLTDVQKQQLIDDLEVTSNNIACPHGRPTRWLISTYEIERKFKRKV